MGNRGSQQYGQYHHHQTQSASTQTVPDAINRPQTTFDNPVTELIHLKPEIPCMFFSWLTYNQRLKIPMLNKVFSETNGHSVLKGYGEWQIVHEHLKDTKYEIIHAFIAVNEKARCVIVAFRGTVLSKEDLHQTVNDWVFGCFNAKLIPWVGFDSANTMPKGSVHRGFFRHYYSIRNELHNQVNYFTSRNYTMIFTGHSQGACLASLSALQCAERIKSYRGKIQLITFGSPKLGNQKFVEHFKKYIPPDHVTHYITSYPCFKPLIDAVTYTPSMREYKRIAGTKKYIKASRKHFGNPVIRSKFATETSKVPISFGCHYQEVYLHGLMSGQVSLRPFTSKDRSLIEEEGFESEFTSMLQQEHRVLTGRVENSSDA